MAVVVDASAVAAVVFGEPGGEAVRRELRGQPLHAPSLIDYELTHVAWKTLRRTPSDAAAILEALGAVARLGVIHAQPDMVQVLALASATGLTTYDASYLWVAKSLGVALVTLDRELAQAAGRL
jgi:predicted nucleic acid-binding protein